MNLPTLTEIQNEQRKRSLARFVQDSVGFGLHSWQTNHLCPALQRLKDERGVWLLIHGPPQYGKSIILSKRLPAWLIGNDPYRRIILAGYSVTHTRDQFAEPVRNLMLTDYYRDIFPDAEIPKICSAEAFSTLARSSLNDGQDSITALGIATGFVGKGVGPGDTLIIDDPYGSPEDAMSAVINDKTWRFWKDGVAERVDPEANVVVMFHRYHDDDIAARLRDTGRFEYIRFPAIADANEDGSDPTGRKPGELLSPMRPLEWLEAIRDEDPQNFASRFQGTPRPEGGGLFQEGYFKIVDEPPPLKFWVRAWDPATSAKQTADFTAGAMVGVDATGNIYIWDMARWRKEWPESREEIVRIAGADQERCNELATTVRDGGKINYAVGFGHRGAGMPMIQDLMGNAGMIGLPIYAIKEPAGTDKKQRASVWAARAAAGKLYLVRGAWNTAFINECLAFRGDGLTKDDQVDAVSGAMELLYQHIGGTLEQENCPEPGSPEYYRRLRQQNQRQAAAW